MWVWPFNLRIIAKTMFGAFGENLKNLEELMRLAKDENFRKFLEHPKVQDLMKDESFKRAVQEKNLFKLMSHREFQELLKDPEIRSALEGMKKSAQKNA